MDKEGSPKMEKPPYESPIKYEIRDIDGVWDLIKNGTYDASGKRVSIDIGERTDILCPIRPSIRFVNGEMEFNLGVFLY